MNDKIKDTNLHIGMALKTSRKNSGLTQTQLAGLILEKYSMYISKDVIYKAETGRTIVPGWLICAYSEICNTSIMKILGEDISLGNNVKLPYFLDNNLIVSLNKLDREEKNLIYSILSNYAENTTLTKQMSQIVSRFKDDKAFKLIINSYENNPEFLNDLLLLINKYKIDKT